MFRLSVSLSRWSSFPQFHSLLPHLPGQAPAGTTPAASKNGRGERENFLPFLRAGTTRAGAWPCEEDLHPPSISFLLFTSPYCLLDLSIYLFPSSFLLSPSFWASFLLIVCFCLCLSVLVCVVCVAASLYVCICLFLYNCGCLYVCLYV